MRIVEDDLSSPEVLDLVQLHLAGMQAQDPSDRVFAFDVDRMRSPDVTVWSAWDGSELLGIAALRVMKRGDEGELKSMRTHPSHMRKGVARALLRHIVDAAREAGLVRISLGSGSGPAFAAGHALYVSEGFVPCPAFGGYPDEPDSSYFTLVL